jgi:hypothetical protein
VSGFGKKKKEAIKNYKDFVEGADIKTDEKEIPQLKSLKP